MIDELIKKMTLKEKIGQLNQRLYGWQAYEKVDGEIHLTDLFKEEVKKYDGMGCLYGVFRSDPWSGKNTETGLTKQEAFQVAQLIQTYIKENTRLGIPVLLSEEAPHGHQALDSLTTPVNYTVGNSFNPELYQQMQTHVARELREKGAHLALVSTLDVARDPRWGRTEESFSEDPYLTGEFTKAAVKGLQGDHPKQVGEEQVVAVLKHFAGQGSSIGGHNAAPIEIGERELKEIHLQPMRAGISVGAQMCMAAYNDYNGIPCHANSYLLNELLRQELGFEGAVMSDGCALDHLETITGSKAEGAAWALASGIDIGLWDDMYGHLEEAVEQGLLSESVIDQAVRRVLSVKDSLGLFTNPTPKVEVKDEESKQALAIRLAEESVVLLKNEQATLPLNKNIKHIAVIGPNADALYNQLGDYTPFKRSQAGVTIRQGIETIAQESGMTVTYFPGSLIESPLAENFGFSLTDLAEVEHIVMVIGGSSARDFDTQFDANGAALNGSKEMNSGENIDLASLELPLIQKQLIAYVAKLGKPMTAVLVQGRPHSISDVLPYFDSIVLAGYPGEYGGTAVANVLFGKITPSGKLAMPIPKSSEQLPVNYNYRDLPFKKDYFNDSGLPAFPFGFGLSYSDFRLSNLSVNCEGSVDYPLIIRGDIENVGQYRAAEVIQVYLKSLNKRVVTRVKELRGFKKIWLEPGEKQAFEIKLSQQQLAEYDAQMHYVPMKEANIIIETTSDTHQELIKLTEEV
ncbi:glycoside hydrolase family 3 N-terminal domain-containing protein [Vagococcus zengguangii]|uniref:Beta-glucosidase n=1 Tax=Vagococcus zengguangii TaxID=2571750 RepID=A0A4D7CST7_9ENTE|nr:glycoside hydrolase family 3 N-terminal domain-containing protein [Vagococcus zengguangii]QCI86193.1 beta-glucosidase [Vagococcus zengguangii]